ncbi:Protein strawberry notch 2 [Saguinus oedipus]|uniref:Protein strawberry notch 2 n=1 Tax=Saguinus oedipus TaxID=9490 RepID=A0ABQ9TPY9_SAGOE|nr:Protein strawberry notch 2 [Saguinus oedipus]
MKQGLLSVGIGGRESRNGSPDMEKDCSITKFLNRILGLEVHKQNALFQYFSDTFEYLIQMDKREGRYDMGILDLAPGIEEIYEESQQVFLAPGHPRDGQLVLYKISVDRGLKWEDAFAKSLELTGPYDGFYLSYKVRGDKPSCLLAEQNRDQLFTVYKPNIGRQSQLEALESLRRKFHRVGGRCAQLPSPRALALALRGSRSPVSTGHRGGGQGALGERLRLLADALQPQHLLSRAVRRNRHCRLVQEGKDCLQGLRLRHHYMLCGALLRVWGRIAAVMSDGGGSSYLQIVRLKTKDRKKQVGIKIPESRVRRVLQELGLIDADVKRRQARALGGPEVLDLTYSPPAEAFPPPPHFSFPAPLPLDASPGALPLGVPDLQADAAALAHQGCDINFKEVLEDMLRSLHAGPPSEGALGEGAGAGGAAGGPERQSVIQFSPPFPSAQAPL